MKKLLMILLPFMLSIQNTLAMNIYYNGSFQNCVDTSKIVIDEKDLTMPGDTSQESLHFENVLTTPLHVYLELKQQVSDVDELIIERDKEEIYHRAMNELDLGTIIDLGVFQPDESTDFTFTIKVPESLNNDYVNTNHLVTWKLVIQEETVLPATGVYSNPVYLMIGLSAIAIVFIAGGKKKHE